MTVWQLISFSLFSSAALLQGCSAGQGSSAFEAQVAECRTMDGITSIVEGRFIKPSKQDKKFDNIRRQLDDGKKSTKTYPLKVSHLHLGRSGITDNRTGKQIKPYSIVIKEEDVPENAIGKRALFCYGGDPSRVLASWVEG